MADFESAYTGAQIDAGIGLANTAVQPAALGTAAAQDVGAFATAAQGELADSAVQPADDAATLGSGSAADGLVLTSDGAGGTAWEAGGGGGGTPGGASGQFQFNDGGIFAAADLWQTANMIEQRNGANAQAFSIYNTYTDAGNFERGFLRWIAGTLVIGTDRSGVGALRNISITPFGSLRMGAQGTDRLSLGTSQLFPLQNNGIGLGIPSLRFSDLFLAGSLNTGAPAGGTAAPWKLGAVSVTTPSGPNRTIEVEIDGVTYYLHAKTNNN